MERYGSPEAILEVLLGVRHALSQLLMSVKMDPGKGRETARGLGLDRNLVWRISRIVNTDDILSVTSDIPTRTHVNKICAACEKLGAPENLVEAAVKSVIEFESVVEECAGNRQYFEAMVSGLVHDDVTQRQESARKLTFLGNLALWGVQARVDFKTNIMAPCETDETKFDNIRLAGLIDFKRARPISWPIHRSHTYWDDGKVKGSPQVPLLETDQSTPGLPLLDSFCSKPIPEIIPVKTDFGKRFDLAAGKFGKVGSLTCVFGDRIIASEDRYRNPGLDDYASAMNDLYTPSELVVLDVFIHKDLGIKSTPEVMVLDRLSMPRGYNPIIDDDHRMPLSAKVLRISAGPSSSYLPQYPEYSKLLQFAFQKVGWEPEHFQGYRFTMAFPPLPSAVVMRCTLPEKP